MSEPILTINDAACLMSVLQNDIPQHEMKNVAMTLLALVANPKYAEGGMIGNSRNKPTPSNATAALTQHWHDYDDDYGEGNYYNCCGY